MTFVADASDHESTRDETPLDFVIIGTGFSGWRWALNSNAADDMTS